jgi:MFS superfamily sulfate permease-like transporter
MGEHRASASAHETIKIKGLARLAAAMFAGWGGLAAFKGVYDLLGGEPEANLYAPKAWAFITKEQWTRYARFELVFGLSCLALAWYCLRWSRRLPETIERPRREPEFSLFD